MRFESLRGCLAAALVVVCALSCGDGGDAPPDADADLTDLVALPYVSWTDEPIDPTQSGVTLHDPERAWPGVQLFTDDINRAFLVDMEGRQLHAWQLPEELSKCHHVELLPDGDLVAVCSSEGLFRIDWRSDEVWSLRQPFHHDVAPLADGSLLVPLNEPLRAFKGRQVLFDAIARVSPGGEILDTWSTFENLAQLRRHFPRSKLDRFPLRKPRPDQWFDYFHLNSVEVLPESSLGRSDERFRAGNLLICLRNVHTILVLDPRDWSVTWSWGPGELSFPHMPTLLASGRILIFDNGVERKQSRVLEIDPLTERVEWSYPEPPRWDFYSKRRGSNQRLPNGNTLICLSDAGRVLEVTPEGETVWEFWSPEQYNGRRKRFTRFMRLPIDEVREFLRRARG